MSKELDQYFHVRQEQAALRESIEVSKRQAEESDKLIKRGEETADDRSVIPSPEE